MKRGRLLRRLLAGFPVVFGVVLMLALLTACDSDGSGAIPARPTSGNVKDDAGILSSSETDEINDLIEENNKETDRVRIAVLTTREAGGDWEDWTRKVANHWGVGDKGKNNGILIAVDMEGRKTRLEVADGARSVVSDDDAQQMLDDVLDPDLKDEHYAEGIHDVTEAIYAKAEEKKNGAAARAVALPDPWWDDWVWLVLGGGMLVALSWAFRARKTGSDLARLNLTDEGREIDAEIKDFEERNPGIRVSARTRDDYMRYRVHFQYRSGKPSSVVTKESFVPGFLDQSLVKEKTLYAVGFTAWLMLYQRYPNLYAAAAAAGAAKNAAPGVYVNHHVVTSNGSSSGSSFGGGGGFSGGGASGGF